MGTAVAKQNFRDCSSSFLCRQWVQLAIITLLGAVIYSNSFHVPFVLDDHYRYQFFGTCNTWDSLFHGGARRVVDLSFALNYKLHGLSLPGYHLTNLVIHLAASITLYYLLGNAIRVQGNALAADEFYSPKFIPFATALLFVSHPVQTEAVTYTIQRYTSLAALFYLFSALAFIKFRYLLDSRTNTAMTWVWAGLTLFSGLLAIGSKQIAATLPAMLIILEYILFNGRYLTRRFLLFCTLILLIIPAVLMQQWLHGTLDTFLYDLRQATSDDQFMSRTTYLTTQVRVVATYLRLLILPIHQNLLYDYPIYTSLFSIAVLSSLALHLGMGAIAVFLLRKANSHIAPSNPESRICLRLISLGIVWFYLSLAVESSIVPIRDVIFEHRIYLPSAGFFLAVCATAALIAGNRKYGRQVAWSILACSCITLGVISFARNRVWADSLTLWQDTALKSPNKGSVQAQLATEYLVRNRPDKALPLFLRALELSPNLEFRVKLGLGTSMKALNIYNGRFTTGEEYVLPGGILESGTLNYGRYKEWSAVIRNNEGLAYELYGEYLKALNSYHNAVWMNPEYDLAWLNLGLVAARLGKQEDIQKSIENLKRVNPGLEKRLRSVLRLS